MQCSKYQHLPRALSTASAPTSSRSTGGHSLQRIDQCRQCLTVCCSLVAMGNVKTSQSLWMLVHPNPCPESSIQWTRKAEHLQLLKGKCVFFTQLRIQLWNSLLQETGVSRSWKSWELHATVQKQEMSSAALIAIGLL